MAPLEAAPCLGGRGGAPAPTGMGSAEGRAWALSASAVVPQFPLGASAASERLPCVGMRLMAAWPRGAGGAVVLPCPGEGEGGGFCFLFWGVRRELWGQGCLCGDPKGLVRGGRTPKGQAGRQGQARGEPEGRLGWSQGQARGDPGAQLQGHRGRNPGPDGVSRGWAVRDPAAGHPEVAPAQA